MSALRFKTNINCANCIRSVTLTLNEKVGADNWQVDTASAEKILTVDAPQAAASQVIHAVEAVGFEIQLLS